MFEYNFFILLVLIVLTGIAASNFILFRKRKYSDLDEYPSISVLIPARNEEKKIKKCVESVLRQDYPDFEVIVLDDNSEDATYKILKSIDGNGKLKILKGKELEKGWTGKNFACHRLYEESKNEYILFADADTTMKPGALKNALKRLKQRNADLYSALPELELNTFWEKVLMPVLHFTTFTLLPYYIAEKGRSPQFAMAAGPFMLFKREAYEKTGGHEAIKNELVEDVRLAKKIKENGMRVVVDDGFDIYKCRMYSSFKEIWEGFSKNIFPGMGYSAPLLFSVFTVYNIIFLLPFVFLGLTLTGIIGRSETLTLVISLQVFLILSVKILLTLKFRLGFLTVLFHPLGIILITSIALNSFRWNRLGRGSLWKGRTYKIQDLNNAEIKSL